MTTLLDNKNVIWHYKETMTEDAASIKRDIIERNETIGGENGHQMEFTSLEKGEYDSGFNCWIRICPNFETKSAKLTISDKFAPMNRLHLRFIEDAKDLIRKWDIEEYCVCDESNYFLMFYQPLELKEKP